MRTSCLASILGLLLIAIATRAAETNQPHHLRWEPAIAKFEARDKTNPPPRDAVVFIGSSSIVKWTNAPAQFPEHVIINRGFGGSHLGDSAAFVERIVIPCRPKLVLLYAGDNDIAAGRTAEQVFAAFKEFVAKVHTAQPRTRIAFVSIKPSPSRAKFLPPIKEANRLIREFSARDERLVYVDVFTPMLDATGQPRRELFVKDMLHLNADGYKLWAGIVKPVLDKFAPPSAQ